MKPFKLQSVLDYRKHLKDLAQQKLYKTIKKEAALTEYLNKEQEELDNLYRDLEKRQQVGLTPHELLLYENHCSHKVEVLKRFKESLESIQKEIADQRQALCEANRDKKLLEKLKEKQIREYKHLLRKKETIETDEIAAQTRER